MCAHKISPIIFRIPTERLWSKTLSSRPQKTKVSQIVTVQLLRSLQSILSQRSCILLFAKLWFQNGKIILTATFFIWVSTNFYTQFRRKSKERRYALLHSLTSSWVLLTGLRRRVLTLLQKTRVFPQLLLLTSFRYYITLLLCIFIKVRAPLLKWYQSAKHSLKIATQLSSLVSHFLKSYSYFFFNKKAVNLFVIPPSLKPLSQSSYYYKFILAPTLSNGLNHHKLKTFKMRKFQSFSNTLLCKYLVNFQFYNFFTTFFSADAYKNKSFNTQALFHQWSQKTTVNTSFSVSWPSSSITTLGISTFFLKLRNRAFQQIFRLSGARYWWGGHSGVTLRCSLLNIIFFVFKQNIYNNELNISLQNRVKIFCRLHWEKIRAVKNLQNIPVWRQAKYILDYIIFVRSLFLIKQQTQFSPSSTLILLDNISNYLSVNLLLVQDKLLARLGRKIRRKFVNNTIRASVVAVLINSAAFLVHHIAEELSLLKRHFIFLNGFRRILRAVLLDIPLFSMFRLVVVGKVGGAKRTKRYVLQLGQKTALNSIQNSVDFAQRSVETIYGSIGLKVWVAKSVYEIT